MLASVEQAQCKSARSFVVPEDCEALFGEGMMCERWIDLVKNRELWTMRAEMPSIAES